MESELSKELRQIKVNHELREAARDGEMDNLVSAIESGADLDSRDENGESALMIVAREDDAENAALLLEAGAWEQENTHNAKGLSSLDIARANGSVDVYELIKAREQG